MSLFGIVGYYHLQVQQGHVLLLGGLHHADTPVNIGRITVLHVVRCGDGKVGAGVEGLMTHQHALLKRFPREVFGRSQSAMTQKTAFAINNVGVAVEHGGILNIEH